MQSLRNSQAITIIVLRFFDCCHIYVVYQAFSFTIPFIYTALSYEPRVVTLMSAAHSCDKCGAPADLRCTACKSVWYCSQACQRAAWKSHKPVCQASAASGRPTGAASTSERVVKEDTKAADDLSVMDLRAFTDVVKSLTDSPGHAGHSSTDWRRALKPETFCQMAYPGISVDELLPTAPKSLLQLLTDAAYENARLQAAQRARKKAAEVLASVKSKAAAAGETLDRDTERSLWPQAFAEAFIREIPTIMRGDAVTVPDLSDDSMLANPMHVLASADYLTVESLAGLCTSGRFFAHQDEFFTGEDAGAWSSIALEDLSRLSVEAHRWSAPSTTTVASSLPGCDARVTVEVSYMWADAASLEEGFPAVSEVMQRLHALPFELNRKVKTLQLIRPQPGMTMVQRLRCSFTPPSKPREEDTKETLRILPFGETPSLLAQWKEGRGFVPKLVSIYGGGCAPMSTSSASVTMQFSVASQQTIIKQNNLVMYLTSSAHPVPAITATFRCNRLAADGPQVRDIFLVYFFILGRGESIG